MSLTQNAKPKRSTRAATRLTPRLVVYRYLYVEARAYPGTWKVDAAGNVHNDNPISFDSIIVEASGEDVAYQMGAALLQNRQQVELAGWTRHACEHHSQQFFLNDYVVKL